ncbi:MAG: hypothetical protein U0V70_09925 [Terriglobia bacterium]
MTNDESAGRTAIREEVSPSSPANLNESIWTRRVEDYHRHVVDLQNKWYEGASSRAEREALFRVAFDLVTPVARKVLDDINTNFLKGTGEWQVQPPSPDGEGGLIGLWSLTWPLLREARNRFNGKPLEPLALTVVFPLTPTLGMQWTHPHIALLRPGLTDGLAAAAIPGDLAGRCQTSGTHPACHAEAKFHERFYQSDLNWRLLPFVVQ